jgi:hypothetical protein
MRRSTFGRRRIFFVVGALIVSGLLIAVALVMDVASAADVCNADSQQEKDELAAERADAAKFALFGALISFVGGIVGLVSAALGQPPGLRWLMVLLGLGGVAGAVGGAVTALLVGAVIC